MISQSKESIPKTIHYCWFGGKPLDQMGLRCIKSWQTNFPGYEIKRWDESNFDIDCCQYVREAYEAGKWAFVSDVARFIILYEYGGLYFDTDVEVIRPFDDIVENGPFMGFELDPNGKKNSAGQRLAVNPGLGLGAYRAMPLYASIIEGYKSDHFDASADATSQETVVDRVTQLLLGYGLKNVGGIQQVADVCIYPAEYFNPKDFYTGDVTITKHTHSIHQFGMSWFSDEERYEHKIASALYKRGITGIAAGKLSALAAMIQFHDYRRLLNAFSKRFSRLGFKA